MFEKVFFDITNRCNGNCKYCFTDANNGYLDNQQELSYDEIQDLIDALYEKGIKKISLGGGEPFLRNVVRICDYMQDDMQLSITTNGTIMSEEIIECLARKKVRVTVSLDSIDEMTAKEIRSQIELERVLKNIEKLVGYEKIRQNLSVRATISTYNIHSIIELIEYCNERTIPTLKMNSVNAFGRAKLHRDMIPEFDNFLLILKEIQTYCENQKLYTKVELPVEKYLSNKRNICTLGKKSIYIDATGNFYPCAFSEGNLVIGNIRNDSLDAIIERSEQFNHESHICKNCMIHRYENYNKQKVSI